MDFSDMYSLDLSSYALNLILNALGKMPYEEVSWVIQDIKEQMEG